jgi:hypothetical protein
LLLGRLEGASDGDELGSDDGSLLGNNDGCPDGIVLLLGLLEGASDGEALGREDGSLLGDDDGAPEGTELVEGLLLGWLEGAADGRLSSKIEHPTEGYTPLAVTPTELKPAARLVRCTPIAGYSTPLAKVFPDDRDPAPTQI